MATIRAVCSGTIDLGSGPVECHVLETGVRVLTTKQVAELLGFGDAERGAKASSFGRSLERLSNKDASLSAAPTPIPFQIVTKSNATMAKGYDALDVSKIFIAYQRAFIHGKLDDRQLPMAYAAMSAIEAFASVGLVAMIDDATGYKRPAGELGSVWDRIYRGSLGMWEEMFDSDWDRSLCRLYGHEYQNRPPVFAKMINHMVYRWTFGNDAYAKLKAENPDPRHHSNHHQLLTDEAKIKLSQTINTVRSVLKLSRTPRDFMHKLSVVYSNAPTQFEMF